MKKAKRKPAAHVHPCDPWHDDYEPEEYSPAFTTIMHGTAVVLSLSFVFDNGETYEDFCQWDEEFVFEAFTDEKHLTEAKSQLDAYIRKSSGETTGFMTTTAIIRTPRCSMRPSFTRMSSRLIQWTWTVTSSVPSWRRSSKKIH